MKRPRPRSWSPATPSSGRLRSECRATRHVYTFPPLPALTVSAPEIVEDYVIEIWAEKSTMNDILVPLARRLGVTLVTGLGELSHTHCNLLVKRVLEHQRKCRILYIADHDPAGHGMPVSIARKIEHILRRDGHDDLDIRLDPLVLTAEQVGHYGLPRIPIKGSDRRKGHFEARFGEGAVELDALEAIHPGELARIIEQRIEVYRAPTRSTRREIEIVADELKRHAHRVREDVLDQTAHEITRLQAQFERIRETIRPHQNALAALVAEYEARMAEHIEAINAEVAQFYDQAEPLSTSSPDLEDRSLIPTISNGRPATSRRIRRAIVPDRSAATSSKWAFTRHTRASRQAGGPATTGDDLYRQRPRAGIFRGQTRQSTKRREDMIDMRKYSSGETYLTIADVRDGALQMTIADAKEGQYEKPDLHFESGDILSLNATNRKILMRAYGLTSDTWIGKQIELVLGQTMFQGAPQDSIIVNPVSPPLTAAEKAAAAPAQPVARRAKWTTVSRSPEFR